MAAKKRPAKAADKLREDANETAFRVLQEALGKRERTKPPRERTEAEKNVAAVERGRKGGERGGKGRARALDADQRSQIAQEAASARWRKEP